MKSTKLELFADYFQFYIQDDDKQYGDLSEAWTQDAVDNLLAVAEHAICIGTVRNMDVSVFVSFVEKLPELDLKEWDRVNTSSLICETGSLVIAGCTDYFPDAKRFQVLPGNYDVVIGYKDLEKISDDGLDGEDSYHLFLKHN